MSLDHAPVELRGHGGPANVLTLGLVTQLWKSSFRFQQLVVRLLCTWDLVRKCTICQMALCFTAVLCFLFLVLAPRD